MAYEIAYKSSAVKELDKLPREIQRRILEAIQLLSDNPRPSGVKKLQSEIDLYRIRIGEYRVVYSIQDGQLKILVVAIGHRRDIYR